MKKKGGETLVDPFVGVIHDEMKTTSLHIKLYIVNENKGTDQPRRTSQPGIKIGEPQFLLNTIKLTHHSSTWLNKSKNQDGGAFRLLKGFK